MRVATRMIWQFSARCRCHKLHRQRGRPNGRAPPRGRRRGYHPGAPRTPARV